MKSVIVSGVLFIVMAAYLIMPAIPVIDYLINKDYIAKKLCVNKNKPHSCCNGKCHMVKQLQKTNQNSDKNPRNTNSRVQIKEVNEFILSRNSSYFAEITRHTYLIGNKMAYNQVEFATIFVPPRLTSIFL
jgi:hypothetical protein